jgi:hypothetical protein
MSRSNIARLLLVLALAVAALLLAQLVQYSGGVHLVPVPWRF